MNRKNEKALFIPINAQHYDEFISGKKKEEFRKYGTKWNEKVCYVGRRVIISKGYGNQNRRSGTITGFKKRHGSSLAYKHQKTLMELFGTLYEYIAVISIELDKLK